MKGIILGLMNVIVLIFLKIILKFFLQKITVSRVFIEKKTLLIKMIYVILINEDGEKTFVLDTQNDAVSFNWNDAIQVSVLGAHKTALRNNAVSASLKGVPQPLQTTSFHS